MFEGRENQLPACDFLSPHLYPLSTPCAPEVSLPGPAFGLLFQKDSRIGSGTAMGPSAVRRLFSGIYFLWIYPLSLDLSVGLGDLGPFNLLKMIVSGNACELLYLVWNAKGSREKAGFLGSGIS